jgi:hypothetical protein
MERKGRGEEEESKILVVLDVVVAVVLWTSSLAMFAGPSVYSLLLSNLVTGRCQKED